MIRHAAAVSLIVTACATPTNTADELGGGDRVSGRSFASRSTVFAPSAAAATAHPLATQVAIDTLKRGGSAVDAAVAANAALGLMEPTGCGLGGDLFAIVWDPKTKKVHGYNGSGRAPLGRSRADLIKKLKGRDRIPPYGSLPVTVPGAADGWFALHEKFGRLPMAEVLAPAIAYAEEGFPVTQLIAHYWPINFKRYQSDVGQEWIEESKNAAATFLPGGKAPAEGEIFKNPHLAQTYRLLATGGRAAFYEGEIAGRIDAYMKRIGGDLALADLSAHQGEWVEPVSVAYRGYRVFELPPNTQGIAALQMLAILEGYPLAELSAADRLHLMVEAKRLAFEDRAAHYADMQKAKVPLEALLSAQYAAKRRSEISMTRARPTVATGIDEGALEAGDTTYLTVADQSGMMVSLIQSNYRGMGSGLVPDGLGFMLQDRGELFSLDPAHPNVYAPGKRPFHTIIPAMVTKDGEPWLSFGLMGGAMQPQGHVQVLVNLIDLGMGLQEAGDAARFRHDGSREPTDSKKGSSKIGTLRVESGIVSSVRKKLESKGHNVEVSVGGFGGYQAILRDQKNGVYQAASEMRKDGVALGY